MKSQSSVDVLRIILPYSKNYQFYAVVGSMDKGPHSIDKLSNLGCCGLELGLGRQVFDLGLGPGPQVLGLDLEGPGLDSITYQNT
jgi:hypothetical protein